AATGAVFFQRDVAGLYCFTTREPMRGRGLGSALAHACHDAARARGIGHALLHATALGRSVYAKVGYREERSFGPRRTLARAASTTSRLRAFGSRVLQIRRARGLDGACCQSPVSDTGVLRRESLLV